MNKKYLYFMPLFLFSIAFMSAFSGSGDGSQGDPYQITNCLQLQEMEDNYGYFPSTYPYYILMNDIDCVDTYNWNGGLGFDPIVPVDAPFGASGGMWYGDFNGQGYTISNLYINRDGEEYLGLFRYVANGGTINNVNFDNMYLEGNLGNETVGLIVGLQESGTMDSVNVTGELIGNEIASEDCHNFDYYGEEGCEVHTGCSYDVETDMCSGTYFVGSELIGSLGSTTVTNSFFTYQAFVPPALPEEPQQQVLGSLRVGTFDKLESPVVEEEPKSNFVEQTFFTTDKVTGEKVSIFAGIINWFKNLFN
jgi:hypothetical protein